MPGDSFGHSFRITTAGESHGPGNVVIIDGCPPGIPLAEADLAEDLARRRPGQSRIVTPRNEPDAPEILSGVFEGKTTGTSIAILIRNVDQRGRDYADIRDKYRPGHADYTYDAKYGRRDYRGGGRASARETVVRVAAGVVAKRIIASAFGGPRGRLRPPGRGRRGRGAGPRRGHARAGGEAAGRGAEHSSGAPTRPGRPRWWRSSRSCARPATRSAAWPRSWPSGCRRGSASRSSTS